MTGVKGERGDTGAPGRKGQKGEPLKGDQGEGGEPGIRVCGFCVSLVFQVRCKWGNFNLGLLAFID